MTVLIQEGNRRCDRRCYDGRGKRCRCICHGKNHGGGLELGVARNQEAFGFMNRSVYQIVPNRLTAPELRSALVIMDVGHTDHKSVTNDAENVVADLVRAGHFNTNTPRRLFYYDSKGQLDEIRVVDGKFAGFAPGPR